jgi:hypothetical protein
MGWVSATLLYTVASDTMVSDNATFRVVCGFIAAVTQDCGDKCCKRSYSVGEERRKSAFFEGCPGLLTSAVIGSL